MNERVSLIELLPVAIVLGVLFGSLLTGKTTNPLKGFSPIIVSRAKHPMLYWTGIAAWIVFLAVGVYFNMDTIENTVTGAMFTNLLELAQSGNSVPGAALLLAVHFSL